MVVDSPFRRLPIYFLTTVAETMAGAPIEAVSQGLVMLVNELMNIPLAVEVASLAVITFGDQARMTVPLVELVSFTPPTFSTAGGRAMGAALRLLREALGRDLATRTPGFKGDYKAIVVLLTDGPPSDPDIWVREAPLLRADRRIANIVALGCGGGVDQDSLAQLTPNVLFMDTLTSDRISSHFVWVSQSIGILGGEGAGGLQISLVPPPAEPALASEAIPLGPDLPAHEPGQLEIAPVEAELAPVEEQTILLSDVAPPPVEPIAAPQEPIAPLVEPLAAPPEPPSLPEEAAAAVAETEPALPPSPSDTLRCILEGSTVLEGEPQPFAESGEGELYWEKSGTYVVQIFKGDASAREPLLRKLLGEYDVVQGDPYWNQLFAWPQAIVRQPRLGVVMPRVPESLMELDCFLGEGRRQIVADKYGPQKLGTWANALALAVRMARIVRRLHEYGLNHADLSYGNFLVDPPNNRVMLIGWDALVVSGFSPPDIPGTPMCMAPELMAQLTSPGEQRVLSSDQTDLHALATLVYWLLLQRHPLLGPLQHDPDPTLDEALALGERALFIEHPTDHVNRPQYLPAPYTAAFTPAVQRLVERAFVEGLHAPEKRPSAAEWERDLVRMADAVVPCANPNCPAHAFALLPLLPVCCPFCATPLQHMPLLPILYFYRPVPGNRGQFQSDDGHALIGWPDRTLHRWHVETGILPGPGVDPTPLARLVYNSAQQAWSLDNQGVAGLRILHSDTPHVPVPTGSSCALTPGQQLLLGDAEQARLLYVQFLRS